MAPHHITDAQAELINGGGQVISHQAIGPAQHHITHLAGAIQVARWR
jgi:hypothetical protein